MVFNTNDTVLKNALNLAGEYMTLYHNCDSVNIEVDWTKDDKLMCWERKDGTIYISCKTVSDALMLIGRALTSCDVTKEQLKPRFDKLGAMIDVSRNSVYNIKTMKKFIAQLAFMGYTECFLYMEDTYELPGYEYFGYRRGRYSVDEQIELDNYAYNLGIELIPCIQTLAHLKTAIRWQYMQPMKDTIDNLMVGESSTNKLVEDMIAHFSRTFKSRRIHLGMDEAVGLGTGRYRLYKGYKDHKEIIKEHLSTVCKLCDKYGLKPMIWDDMLFRDDTPLMNYYGDSAPITKEKAKDLPNNLTYVYWDYYHNTKEEYDRQIKRRGCLDTVFAGGVWKWGSFTPNFTKSFKDSICAIQACCENNVNEIIVTLWGDDGDEAPLACVLPGMVLFGLMRFAPSVEQDTNAMCLLLSSTDLQTYKAMEYLDLIPQMNGENLEGLVPHKLLLYGDIASELFMGSLTDDVNELLNHYRKLIPLYENMAKNTKDSHIKNIMIMYKCLASAIFARCDVADHLHRMWETKELSEMMEVISKLETFAQEVKKLHEIFIVVWSNECKGQGLEIIDLRLGGIVSRCRSLCQRLKLYQKGQIDTLTELDEKELPYKGKLADDGHTPGRESYGEIVTANTLCHQFDI